MEMKTISRVERDDLFDGKSEKKAGSPRQNPSHRHHSRMENASVPQIVRERLAALNLNQIPPRALAILSRKLEGHLRRIAEKTITPRATARAVLAAAHAQETAIERNFGGGSTEPTANP